MSAIESPGSPGPAGIPLTHSRKACEFCRLKKIRCDRNAPCSNCQRLKLQCTRSQRASRPIRNRVQRTIGAEYGDKIDLIDRRLEQMDRCISQLATDGTSRSRQITDELAPSSSNTSNRSICSPPSIDSQLPTSSATQNILPVRIASQHVTASPATEANLATGQQDGEGLVLEGGSSLSAHSSLAIDFLDRVAVEDRRKGHDFETRELLDSLRQIVHATKAQPPHADGLFSFARPSAPVRPDSTTMPPIKLAAAAIRNAEDQRLITWSFFSVLLGSKSLSDICLKVYFSEDFSIAEYIILNIALYCYFRDEAVEETERPDNHMEEYKLACQQNLETALSGLSLHIIPSHDMTLALLSGAIYAIELPKPSMAWILVLSAYQSAYFLGYHTRKAGSPAWCDTSCSSGLLFWAIYYLEKTLCLRLGRCSTIPDFEITVPFPGGSPAMDYCRNMVKFATLAGKVYEKLYSAQALVSLNEDGAFRVMTLSQELDAIHEQSQDAIREWHRSAVNEQQRALIEYMSASDEIPRYSMQTLIHRTLPAPAGSHVSFTKECIDSARNALMCHQSSSIFFLGAQASLLTLYMSWIILFTPFAPFFVLFCHVIETGDREDLDRMQNFVNSIKPAYPVSSIVAKHHRLFQLFYEVASRYNELKSTSKVQQNGYTEVSTEFSSYLNALGFQPSLETSDTASSADAMLNDNSQKVSADVSADNCRETIEADPTSQLPAWFHMSQQMMGLLNNDDMPF